ncbi:armadillo-type protein [Baffinella frigidus]|nr:armadillo-type protein [Cryptophyta sp. CCMP2293]
MAHHDGNAAIITKEGGVDMIVKAMASAERDKATQAVASSERDKATQVRGLRAIQRIADNGDEGVKNQLAKSGGLTAVVQGMKSHASDPVAQEKGCGAIAALAQNGNAREGIIEQGGIEACLEAMARHAEHTPTQKQVLPALHTLLLLLLLLLHPHRILLLLLLLLLLIIIIIISGILILLRMLSSSTTSSRETGCLALKEMAGSLEDRERVVKNKGVKIIVEAMRKHGQDVGVCEYGCAALMRLAFDPPTAIAIGNEAGIHDIIINAMKDHPLSPEVQEEACWVIIFLTSDKKHEKIFIKGGAVKIVKEAVERHFDVDSLQEQIVEEAVERHFDVESFQEQGRMALDNLGPKGREESLKLKRQQDSLKVEVGGGGEAGEVGVEKSACCVVM